MARRWLCILLSVVVACTSATPAAAWKPKTHIYLANQALNDAVDDGKVTIYETEYATGKIVGVLGSFDVNPDVLAALRARPDQFRAGVVGPDAYPDLLTGQQIIHPGGSLSLLGDPTAGESPSAPGTDAWLTHLWRLAYGPKSQVQVTLEQMRMPGFKPPRNDTPEVRAFVAGYVTHAAGDMFMHTFVNHYAGGDFALQPDPMNAIKHVVLEGYVGLRTPDVGAGGISIDGVDNFIYREMTYARPDTILDDRLLRGPGKKASIPTIFSKLRNGLQRDVDRYDRERLDRRGPERVAYAAANGPLAEYKKAWIDDIDEGLRAWPGVSHEIGKALVYDPTGGKGDLRRAKDVATKYAEDHLISMAGVPDAVIATAVMISNITSAILPAPLAQMLSDLKKKPLEWMIKEATGKSLDEWAAYLNDPEQKFDPVMNSPGGGYGGRKETRTTLAEFNRAVLGIDDPGTRFMDKRFKIETFPPAFNTVQMTKIGFLSEKGMIDLLAALKAKGVDVPASPASMGRFESAMLGFLTSIDADNEWQGLGDNPGEVSRRSFLLARGGAGGWQKLFLRQTGERSDWPKTTAPMADPTATPDDKGFEPIEQWAVRLDEVTYDGAKGPNVTVTLTIRNDTKEPRLFREDSMRTALERRDGMRGSHARMEYAHATEAALPAWHYPPGTPMPPKGRVTVRYVYQVGDDVKQRLVHQLTLTERKPKGGVIGALQFVDGKAHVLKLPALNLDGTVGQQPPPPGAQAAADISSLNALEGTYRTNRKTLLTLKVENGKLVGRAVNDYVPKNEREVLTLTLMADGSLQGKWREDVGRQVMWFDVNIRFAADNNSFAGTTQYSSFDPPMEYKGERVGDGKDSAKSGADGFKEGGFLALRLESAARMAGETPAPIEVTLTARNYRGGRQGVQYNDGRFVLVGSNGVEYRTDGNHYGQSGEDRLVHTIWLEQDEQAAIAYVFPGVPAGVTPAKLLVKEGDKVVVEFDLAAAPAKRGVEGAKAAAADGINAGEPVALSRYEARLLSLNRDAEGDWEAVASFKNSTNGPLKLGINDVGMALYDAQSVARRNNGSFYQPQAGPRQSTTTSIVLQPGGEVKVRLWFPQSAGMTPVRYRLHDTEGAGKDGPVPAAMTSAVSR